MSVKFSYQMRIRQFGNFDKDYFFSSCSSSNTDTSLLSFVISFSFINEKVSRSLANSSYISGPTQFQTNISHTHSNITTRTPKPAGSGGQVSLLTRGHVSLPMLSPLPLLFRRRRGHSHTLTRRFRSLPAHSRAFPLISPLLFSPLVSLCEIGEDLHSA